MKNTTAGFCIDPATNVSPGLDVSVMHAVRRNSLKGGGGEGCVEMNISPGCTRRLVSADYLPRPSLTQQRRARWRGALLTVVRGEMGISLHGSARAAGITVQYGTLQTHGSNVNRTEHSTA